MSDLPIQDENEGDGVDHGSCGELMELFEVLEWNEAVKATK